MQPETNKTVIFELADALLRSWWTLVAGICAGLAGALVALSQTPKQYEATATILITPPSIANEFIRSTVNDELTRRMLTMEEIVLLDRYMLELIERTRGKPKSPEQLEHAKRRIRKRMSVSSAKTKGQSSSGALLSFDLTFRDVKPERAALTVNTLAELYIKQNTEFRTSRARETTETIEARLASAKAAFEAIEVRLNEFNTLHAFETEAHLNTNLRLLENAQRDLEKNEINRVLVDERRQELEAELAQLGIGSTYERRLAALRKELEGLLVDYSEVHPAVIKHRRAIEEMEAAADAAGQQGHAGPRGAVDPQLASLQEQLEGVNRSLTVLSNDESRLKREISEYQRRIDAVPEIQPQLTALLNEHTTLRERYTELQRKAETAKDSQFLEESEQSARYELASRAEVPFMPVFPQPKRFYTVGLFLGCLFFVGPLLVSRLLNPLISSEAGLRAFTDVPVLVNIPKIATPDFRGYQTRRFVKNLSLSAVCTGALVALIRFLG